MAVRVALPAPFLLAKRSANFMASGPRIQKRVIPPLTYLFPSPPVARCGTVVGHVLISFDPCSRRIIRAR